MHERISPDVIERLKKRIVCEASEPALMTLEEPFTGQPITQIPLCDDGDVEAAVRRARKAQRLWASKPVSQRAAVLKRYHDVVYRHREQLLDMIQCENGKARSSAAEEVLDVMTAARHYGYHGAKLLRPQKRKGAFPLLTSTELHFRPRGVVGMITPWNFPFNLPLGDALPALLAGNAVVLKPAANTSLTALLGVELLEAAGLPPDLLTVVTGTGASLGPSLIKRVDFLQFSGSTPTGKKIAEACAKELIEYSLELGGKNPAIVFDDAPFNRAVNGVLQGVLASTGQMCVHIERVYVQDSIYDRFVDALVHRAKQWKMGSGYDFNANMGTLTSAAQLEKVSAHVDDAVARGAKVLTGGNPRPDLGPYFFEPTLLEGVTDAMMLAREETFGPVAALYRFRTTEEVLDAANDSEYGLNASVWTSNGRRGRAVASWLQTGTVNVNDGYAPGWGSVDSPMGGFKQSGIGRRHGDPGLLKYTEPQTIASQHLMNLAAPKGMGDRAFTNLMFSALRILKRIPGLR